MSKNVMSKKNFVRVVKYIYLKYKLWIDEKNNGL